MSSLQEFSIGGNRERPKYAFQRKECPNCGGSVPLYSEQSQLVVCQYCGSSLDCTKEELTALGKKNKTSYFVFDLHQEGVFDGIKYKVIARMCVRDQWNDITREYLLFHPFHGTRWLSEYQNSYSLSYSCRARDKSFSFENPQDMIRTGDGRMWNVESSTTMTLVNVDGALPWIASLGDKTKVVEYIENQNSGSYLTVEQENDGKEVSYSYSRSVARDEVFASFGLNRFGSSKASPTYKRRVQHAAILVMAISLILGVFSRTRTEVGTYQLEEAENDQEEYMGVIHPSFYLSEEDIQSFIQIEYNYLYRRPNLDFLYSPQEANTTLSFAELETLEEKVSPDMETVISEPAKEFRLKATLPFDLSYLMNQLDQIGFDQKYPTQKLIQFDKPGHYRPWVGKCHHIEDCQVVISKSIQLLRGYVFVFFLAAIVWFQARRTA